MYARLLPRDMPAKPGRRPPCVQTFPKRYDGKRGTMTYPQSTLDEIIDSERAMLREAETRYGLLYTHARASTSHLSNCVVSVEYDRSETFGRLFSLMKKQHTLALFSAVRLHKVQAMMNLRQVLEAGAAAAFAIAKPEPHHFVDIDPFGIMDASQKLTGKRYRWLEQNYAQKSKWIVGVKGLINDMTAHANIIVGDNTFRVSDKGDVASTPFFDIEDEYFVKSDLWLIGSVAIYLMDLFVHVASDVAKAGRGVIEFQADLHNTIHGLATESNALNVIMTTNHRCQATAKKMQQRLVSPLPPL